MVRRKEKCEEAPAGPHGAGNCSICGQFSFYETRWIAIMSRKRNPENQDPGKKICVMHGSWSNGAPRKKNPIHSIFSPRCFMPATNLAGPEIYGLLTDYGYVADFCLVGSSCTIRSRTNINYRTKTTLLKYAAHIVPQAPPPGPWDHGSFPYPVVIPILHIAGIILMYFSGTVWAAALLQGIEICKHEDSKNNVIVPFIRTRQ